MTEPLDLDALEALEKAATPGPWWVASSGGPSWDKKVLGPFRSAEMPTRTEAGVLSYGGHVEERNRPGNNADLIVAARNVLPELIRRARLLDEAVALLLKLRPTLHGWGSALRSMGANSEASPHYTDYLNLRENFRELDKITAHARIDAEEKAAAWGSSVGGPHGALGVGP